MIQVGKLAERRLQSDKTLILKAMTYRSGSDSCTSLEMGSMAAASLYHILGLRYGVFDGVGFEETLKQADRPTVDRLLASCKNIIDYMEKNPRVTCPCCGGVTTPATVRSFKRKGAK